MIFKWLFQVVLLVTLHASEPPQMTKNGGILPYYYDDQKKELYFLLGCEKRPYRISNYDDILVTRFFPFWQDFGGNLELSNQETSRVALFNACLEEAYEELHVIFPSLALLSDIAQFPPYIQNEKYTFFLIRLPTKISVDLLDCYFVSMEKLDGGFIFDTFRGDNQPAKEFDFSEKNKYQWFTLQEIMSMATNTTDSFLNPLYEQVKRNKHDHMKTDLKEKTEIEAIFTEIKKTIMTEKLELLFGSFIPFFKDSDAQDTNNTFCKSSIISLINNGTLQGQPCFLFNKWFTTLYCLLYRKIGTEKREIFQFDSSKNAYLHSIQCSFDTKDQFIDIFTSIETELNTINYDKSDIIQFLKDIHFQINTDSQTAYCAFEIKGSLPVLEYVENSQNIQDHTKYVQSFRQGKKYENIMPKACNFQKYKKKNLEKKLNDKDHFFNGAWSSAMRFFRKKFFLFGGITGAGFLFACFWYIKYLK
ncbi:MAG TPA: hypothetical protein VL201_01540 [Patescibacteria group bacterium]|nr:hypothetical protein [Patescibacteria group bacterium]